MILDGNEIETAIRRQFSPHLCGEQAVDPEPEPKFANSKLRTRNTLACHSSRRVHEHGLLFLERRSVVPAVTPVDILEGSGKGCFVVPVKFCCVDEVALSHGYPVSTGRLGLAIHSLHEPGYKAGSG